MFLQHTYNIRKLMPVAFSKLGKFDMKNMVIIDCWLTCFEHNLKQPVVPICGKKIKLINRMC